MTITSQQYADLSSDAYHDRPVGYRKPNEREKVTAGGVVFEVMEHVDNRRTGYQGTIYQRPDTREIVVAHRGTEQLWQDGVLADGGMVVGRSNLQSSDAIALTRRARQFAEDAGRYGTAPEVTVTGHSLGGCLAQITAHRFGLHGQTFNAYGAVSLKMGIPEGGERVINHVMASDVVSAGSAHYGQMQVYATQTEIDRLARLGYDNDRGGLLDAMQRNVVGASVGSLGEHSISNFSPDRDSRADTSILRDPHAQQRARDNAAMINKYRNDVEDARGVLSAASDVVREAVDGLRSLPGAVETLLNRARGVTAPGTPGPSAQPEAMPNRPAASPADASQTAQPSDRTTSQAMPSWEKDPLDFLNRWLAAAKSGDDATFRRMTQIAADSDSAREMRQRAIAAVDAQEQQAAQASQLKPEPEQRQRGHSPMLG